MSATVTTVLYQEEGWTITLDDQDYLSVSPCAVEVGAQTDDRAQWLEVLIPGCEEAWSTIESLEALWAEAHALDLEPPATPDLLMWAEATVPVLAELGLLRAQGAIHGLEDVGGSRLGSLIA